MRRIYFALAATALLLFPARAEEDCRLTLAASLPMQPGDPSRVLVPVEVEGKMMNFLIDTGSLHSGISSAAVDKAGLETHTITSGNGPVFPLAGGPAKSFVKLKSLKLGDMTAPHVELAVMPQMERTADGLLGTDFLHQFDLEFDFAGGKLNLFQPHPCRDKVVYWSHTAPVAIVPFENDYNHQHIRLSFELDGKSVNAILDTGAPETSISVSAASLWYNIDEHTLGVTPRGHRDYVTHFKTLAFDGISIENPEIELRHDVKSGQINYTALLGLSTLRHFHLYISYRDHKIWVTDASAK